MLKKLYDCNCFDYKEFIHQNQKKLSLSNDEAMVLIQMLNIYKTKKTISVSDLSPYLNMAFSDIENALGSLLERDFYSIFISYEDGLGEESMLFDGFFSKATDILNGVVNDCDNELYTVSKWLNKKLNRLLSSTELDIISSLVENDKKTLGDFERAYSLLESTHKLVTIKTLASAFASDKRPVQKDSSNKLVKSFMNSIK